MDIGGKWYLPGGAESYKTMNNISDVNQLVTALYQGLSYVLLGDAGASSDVDFNASTVAVNTQCKTISAAVQRDVDLFKCRYCDELQLRRIFCWRTEHCGLRARGTTSRSGYEVCLENDSVPLMMSSREQCQLRLMLPRLLARTPSILASLHR
jgi:hypothetical protein